MNTVFKWFNDRLPIVNTFERHLSKHPVPKKVNFWYLFGALASVVLIIQIISGIWRRKMRHSGSWSSTPRETLACSTIPLQNL